MEHELIKQLENEQFFQNSNSNNYIHFARPSEQKQPTIGFGYDIEQNGFDANDLNTKAGSFVISSEQMSRLQHLYQKTNLTTDEVTEYKNLRESITITKNQANTLFQNMINGWENSFNTILANKGVANIDDHKKEALISIFYNTCGATVSAISTSHPSVINRYLPMLGSNNIDTQFIGNIGIWYEILYNTNP